MPRNSLIIGKTQREQIATLREFAAAKPSNMEDMRRAVALKASNPDLFDTNAVAYTITLPNDYLVTYSHEQQEFGLCHHISISIKTRNRLPHEAAVAMICEEFGMGTMADLLQQLTHPVMADPQPDKILTVWIEDVAPGIKAINLIVPVNVTVSSNVAQHQTIG
jgi:hypothetical protein